MFLSYYVNINCYVYLAIHSAQTLIILISINKEILLRKFTKKVKFDFTLYLIAFGCSACWYIAFFLDDCVCKEYSNSKKIIKKKGFNNF